MCHILIQNEQLEQVDTFSYLRSLITEDGEFTIEFRTVQESIRMTEDRDKWRKYVHGVANSWIEDG